MRHSTLRTALIAGTAGLALLVPAGGTALATQPETASAEAASAAPRARVCLVIAPKFLRVGHVGWMVQDTARNRWVGGATEDGRAAQPGATPDRPAAGSWSESGTYRALIDTFKSKRGDYEKMRCRYSRHGDAANALKVFNLSTYRDYSFTTDNCLIRSVESFKAYSSEFRNLPSGKYQRPNAYYDSTLKGWTTVRL
ncbi:hypothetical protein ACFZCL_02985 [Streptomyces sp. NPDC008159]|uniref:hypothetical protein n=1 Tax=Streptomyces sp. NPDC008159 TaxID=3364817 RepID=UPI0036E912E0